MATQPVPNRDEEELVDVYETMEEAEAWVVQGLLESAGIPSVVGSREAPQDVLPGVGGVAVRVNAENAEDARRIIEEYRRNPPQEQEIELSEQETEKPETP